MSNGIISHTDENTQNHINKLVAQQVEDPAAAFQPSVIVGVVKVAEQFNQALLACAGQFKDAVPVFCETTIKFTLVDAQGKRFNIIARPDVDLTKDHTFVPRSREVTP